MIGAANVDELEFELPDDVRVRPRANRHLAFGGGPHRCLGSHLARLELRVAIEEFHRRIPEYTIAPGADIQFSLGIRQAENLPLHFPARVARPAGVSAGAVSYHCPNWAGRLGGGTGR